MDFETLIPDSLKLTIEMAAKDVGDNVQLYEELFALSLVAPNPMGLKASRVLDLCLETYPQHAALFVNRIVAELPTIENESVVRNFLHILGRSHQPISDENWMRLLDSTLAWVVSPQQAIAVRIYAMDVLMNLRKEQPELSNEIKYALEAACIESSTAVRGRAKRYLKMLKEKP